MTDIDQDTRLSIIREICRKEGHGDLDEWTRFDELAFGRRYSCRRGCGIAIYETRSAVTLEELDAFLKRRNLSGTVRLRGTIEVER